MPGLIALGLRRPVLAAALVAAADAFGIIALALVFQHGFGYEPCPLCLRQRWPYYIGVPSALLLAALADRLPRWLGIAGLLALAGLFAWGLGLGIYQAGAEWAFWPGPTDCAAGNSSTAPAAVGGLLGAIAESKVVSCTNPSFRFLGLSFAGWNAVVMACLVATTLGGAIVAGRSGRETASPAR
jgi:disulfide bond formation protein DsbB